MTSCQESHGVRPSLRCQGRGELVVEFIDDHYVHSAVFKPATYGDFISFGALKFLYKEHESLYEQNNALHEEVARLKQATFGISSEKSTDVMSSRRLRDPNPVVEINQKIVDLDEVRERAAGGENPCQPIFREKQRTERTRADSVHVATAT